MAEEWPRQKVLGDCEGYYEVSRELFFRKLLRKRIVRLLAGHFQVLTCLLQAWKKRQ